MDNQLEHHALKGIINQRVKDGTYHIQHVNSTHNRVKKWLDGTFWGVSTKYIQQYLDWFSLKEQLKTSRDPLRDFVPKTVESVTAYQRYANINNKYQNLIATQI
jgi:hypothetical protein